MSSASIATYSCKLSIETMEEMLNLRWVNVFSFLPSVLETAGRVNFVLLFKSSKWQTLRCLFTAGEYGGPKAALNAGDHKAVFVLAEPEKIPRHNFYEFVWFLKTGLPRFVSRFGGVPRVSEIRTTRISFQLRMMAGGENFIYDKDILNEGFKKHSTP